jgi:hypothetical protein
MRKGDRTREHIIMKSAAIFNLYFFSYSINTLSFSLVDVILVNVFGTIGRQKDKFKTVALLFKESLEHLGVMCPGIQCQGDFTFRIGFYLTNHVCGRAW